MGVHHKIKIWPQFWIRVFEGTKTFEVRQNDRFYQKGDKVTLVPFNPATSITCTGLKQNGYEMCELERYIGDVYNLDGDMVVFSILKEPPK